MEACNMASNMPPPATPALQRLHMLLREVESTCNSCGQMNRYMNEQHAPHQNQQFADAQQMQGTVQDQAACIQTLTNQVSELSRALHGALGQLISQERRLAQLEHAQMLAPGASPHPSPHPQHGHVLTSPAPSSCPVFNGMRAPMMGPGLTSPNMCSPLPQGSPALGHLPAACGGAQLRYHMGSGANMPPANMPPSPVLRSCADKPHIALSEMPPNKLSRLVRLPFCVLGARMSLLLHRRHPQTHVTVRFCVGSA
eukprot:4548702-Pleurochrysis_carterae.AAC.1